MEAGQFLAHVPPLELEFRSGKRPFLTECFQRIGLLSPLSQRTDLTKGLQFTQITGNYGEHQESYFHGLFTAFSPTFHGHFTAFSHLSS
jgi:hypothetical protein